MFPQDKHIEHNVAYYKPALLKLKKESDSL